MQCQIGHDKEHNIKDYNSIHPDIENINNKMNKFKENLVIFNNEIDYLTKLLAKVKNNVNKCYEINNKILNSYEISKRNYQILQSINGINNQTIFDDLEKIINENDMNLIIYLVFIKK